jgi:glucose dehydrogenase
VNPTVVGSQVFVGSCSGILFAFDRESGFVNWEYDTAIDDYRGNFHGQPLLSEGTIVIGTDAPDAGYIYALRTDSGEARWKVKVAEGAAANIVRVGKSVVTNTLSDRILSLDFATGKQRWSVDSGSSQAAADREDEEFSWTASPVTDGKRIFWGRRDGLVTALEPEKGESVWQTEVGGRVSAHPVLVGGTLYVGTADRRLYRLNAETGAILSSLELEATPMWEFTPVDGGLMVLLEGADTFVAVDLKLSKVLWRLEAAGTWSSFRPVRMDDAVLVGSDEGELVAASARTGKVVWKTELGGALRGLCSHEDELYVGNLQGKFFALTAPSLLPPTAKQPTPEGMK